MRPSAYLINTARGPIVDEKALVRALEEKRIAGAALDVYEREPMVEPALVNLPNVVLTPHLGSAARDTRERIAGILVDNVIAVIEGRRPPNIYNPEIYGSWAIVVREYLRKGPKLYSNLENKLMIKEES